MSKFEVTVEVTRARIMRKHNKDSMADVMFKAWRTLHQLDEDYGWLMDDDERKKLQELLNRIVWG